MKLTANSNQQVRGLLSRMIGNVYQILPAFTIELNSIMKCIVMPCWTTFGDYSGYGRLEYGSYVVIRGINSKK